MTATATESAFRPENQGARPAIVAAGLLCGVLDICAAFTHAYFASGATPGRILQAVASGLLGKQSFELGAASMAFGLALHFAVAFSWAVIFYALSRKLSVLTRRAVVSGIIYGAVVYGLMNSAVLPFASWFRSFYLHTPVVFAPKFPWPQLLIHITCVGLPIALMVKKYSRAAG
ncbi:hypothetical protein [Oleiharenicola lentus]|uniref:hypothetical protein n=1 Tax=Oleiharenicola lentus TaxID=2508720 RepID=UPI003F67875C